jgi:hypothetical protein
MRTARRRAWLVAGAIAVLSIACGGAPASPSSSSGQSSTPDLGSGPLVFRASPIDPAAIRWITPLGNLNPPGHATPTDHIYFYFADPDRGELPEARRTPFFAPGDGTITNVFATEPVDRKLFIRSTNTVSYYVDHLVLDPGIAVGTVLTAGQRIGTTGLAYAIDLGVVNTAVTVPGLLNRTRYIDETLHADGPLKYFEGALHDQLYAKVQRLGSELDGRIGYDVAGSLSGNWYSEGS